MARQHALCGSHRTYDIPNVNVPELRDDGTYLITGGLGSLGLQTAKHLVREGARHLLLTGRSGVAGKEAGVAELEALGASVTVVQSDIADPDDVRRMLATPMPPLRGIIHAAGVLDDGMAAQQSLERLLRVLAPKVHGAWNLTLIDEGPSPRFLHLLFIEMPLWWVRQDSVRTLPEMFSIRSHITAFARAAWAQHRLGRMG